MTDDAGYTPQGRTDDEAPTEQPQTTPQGRTDESDADEAAPGDVDADDTTG